MLIVELKCFVSMTRRTKTPRKPPVKKGSQASLKDPVGVRSACEFVYSFFSPFMFCMLERDRDVEVESNNIWLKGLY